LRSQIEYKASFEQESVIEMSARAHLVIGLDYELFFGPRAGTPERCLIEPTELLAQHMEEFGARLVLFVDAGYLVRARHEAQRSAEARRQFDLVAGQLSRLAQRGHDLQLHVHPHWEDSVLEGSSWQMRTTRYRLADFDAASIGTIVSSYRRALEEIKGAPVNAYRAGGWCIQPFDKVREALLTNGIVVDSTVYAGGHNPVLARAYDFRTAPSRSTPWTFDDDPLQPTQGGIFSEVPISSFVYGAGLFWRMALNKVLSQPRNRPFGDGQVIGANSEYYWQRLSKPTQSPVSIDGQKAAILERAFGAFQRTGDTVFNVMGHPKSLTPSGASHVRDFLRRRHREFESLTLADTARIQALAAAA
jgi:hypothetical protein